MLSTFCILLFAFLHVFLYLFIYFRHHNLLSRLQIIRHLLIRNAKEIDPKPRCTAGTYQFTLRCLSLITIISNTIILLHQSLIRPAFVWICVKISLFIVYVGGERVTSSWHHSYFFFFFLLKSGLFVIFVMIFWHNRKGGVDWFGYNMLIINKACAFADNKKKTFVSMPINIHSF